MKCVSVLFACGLVTPVWGLPTSTQSVESVRTKAKKRKKRKKRRRWKSRRRGACPLGQSISPDTQGHCCWPGQAWAGKRCVGELTGCPTGFALTEDRAACELLACVDGRQRMADGVHCCWPEQAWHSGRAACLGEPSCPKQWVSKGSDCAPGPELTDSDEDSVFDATDKCPDAVEDIDGWEDEDGCPDPDNDGDGVTDGDDNCPDEPEDPDQFQDDDGCPDLDNDHDNVPDATDKCPNEAEDMDGREDEDGCPDDDDGDGVPDAQDQCPAALEDQDGWEDEDGCPELDNDADGLRDADDQCPNEAEDFDLYQDEDGCPDADNDGDEVPDDEDRCPHNKEDGEGLHPRDGCEVPISETLQLGLFGGGRPSWEVGLARTRYDYTAFSNDLDDGGQDGGWNSHTISFLWHLGPVTLGHSVFWALGVDGDDFMSVDIQASAGVNLLTWPRFDRSAVSILSVTVGGHAAVVAGFDHKEKILAMGGWFVRNTIYLGRFALSVEYKAASITTDPEEFDPESLGEHPESSWPAKDATAFTVGVAFP